MRVTLDTNVLGSVAMPALYPSEPALDAIRKEIESKRLRAFMSEASFAMEALHRKNRIDVFIRAWATQQYPINLPELPQKRVDVIENALSLGIKMLHAPRIALGCLYELSDEDWAKDEMFQIGERQKRFSCSAKNFSNIGPEALKQYIGPRALKQLGAELVGIHSLSTWHLEHLENLPSWPTVQKMMWMQGLLAELDQPKKFQTKEEYINHVRKLIAEWNDLDILASHYSYGNDVLCTLDSAKGTGSSGIFHSNQRSVLTEKFGVVILSPEELIAEMKN